MIKTAVIVDGYSTGQHLPAAFRSYGKTVVHVQSSANIPEILRRSYHPENFDVVLPYADVEQVAAMLRQYGGIVVLPGAESGVLFADELNQACGLSWNVVELSLARRHKFEMIAALQEAGLPTAKQIISASSSEICKWALEQEDWPIVLKPPLSTSSEDVYFCRTPDHIHEGVRRIVGKTNFLGIRNDAAVAQSFLEGPIYVVNSVSLEGSHLTTDVWCFEFVENTQGSIKFTNHYLLDRVHPFFQPLVEYNNKALDAVGIRNGPSHSELKLTRRGPRLVETNARLMGATIEHDPFVAALGTTQVDFTAMAACDQSRFVAQTRQPYQLSRHLRIVWVHFPATGVIVSDKGCHLLERLRSFAAFFGRPGVGDLVGPSADTTGRGGFIYLVHEDPDIVQQDAAKIMSAVEACSLFELGPLRSVNA